MPVSASVQHSSATASSGRLLTVRPSAATPSRITAACWASSATMTGSALPASSSTGWVAVALTRSHVCQIRSVRIELPTMLIASIENVTRVARTACATPRPAPCACSYRGCSRIRNASGRIILLASGPGSRSISSVLCRISAPVRWAASCSMCRLLCQRAVQVIEVGLAHVHRDWGAARRQQGCQVGWRVRASDPQLAVDVPGPVGQRGRQRRRRRLPAGVVEAHSQLAGQAADQAVLRSAGDHPAGPGHRQRRAQVGQLGQVVRGVDDRGTGLGARTPPTAVFPAPLWRTGRTLPPAPTSRLKPSSAAVVPYLLTSPAATSISNRRPAVVIYTVYDLQCKAMEDRRQVILDAAMALADERGLDAVSMRAVAGRVGVTPMALYPHVGSKAELLDAMMGRLIGELLPPSTGRAEVPASAGQRAEPLPGQLAERWQDRFDQFAHAARNLARRHPWIASLLFSRPAVAPDALRAVGLI